ncbi:sterol desaturase family protein [Flectobacillus major]|jgi:sterol desaturase/sphingolipid hydroxylase (fatty acid hydroxylase superfamily)|uniref:sterol desaturase family protein n=1 Tax=Flectobacillus major TaxID=103 RepID=UPI00047ABA9D|nr:sterol desaturase family protein [Flectobacillus major]
MHTKYLAFAIPLFLVLMTFEFFIARKQGRKLYSFKDTISNLNVGIAERLIDCFTVGIFYFFYDYIQKNWGILDIQSGVISWIALLLLTDLLWYWYHRLGHEVNLLWSVHIVHHQSEEFNFTVSARITIFQAVARTFFWSILPIIGFSADMITIVLMIHGIYPFFTHTRTVGKLGILEYILVTPSHHRVHHACNEQYLDKNYSDMFIIWDKIFGTFAEEVEEPVYGLTKPIKSYSFLWQHFHFMLELLYACRQVPTWKEKLKILFGKPEIIDPEIRNTLEHRFLVSVKEESSTGRFKNYVTIQMIVILGILFGVIYYQAQIPVTIQVLIAVLILLTLVNCGALLEQKRWIFYLEYSRLCLTVLIIGIYFSNTFYLSLIVGLLTVISLFFRTLNSQYLRLLYGVN